MLFRAKSPTVRIKNDVRVGEDPKGQQDNLFVLKMKKLRTKETKWQYVVLYFYFCVPDLYYNVTAEKYIIWKNGRDYVQVSFYILKQL